MLEARNISLTIDSHPILQELSCHFAPAEITVVTGPNGSGKTMLLQVLAGLRQYEAGQVLLNGREYPQEGQQLGTGVGIVFQPPKMQVIEQTVEEDILFGLKNIDLPPEERERRLSQTLKWSRLDGHRHQNPHTLSGGELCRLAIGGIIAMGADYILLDEPFENLDYPGVREILHQILQLQERGHGVIIVTHDLEKCLAHAKRLILLKEGKVIANDIAEKVLDCLEEQDVRRPHMKLKDMTWF